MKYLMLVCAERPADEATGEPGRPVGPAPEQVGIEAWTEEMDGRGVRLLGEVVRPGSDSTTVRVRDGKVVLADGAHAERDDVILGFDVLDCADLDEAVRVASKHPMAREGVLELRPFWDD